MPRSNRKSLSDAQAAPKLPDLEHIAMAIYEKNYANAYQARVKQFPHLTFLLKEMSRCEALLDYIAALTQAMHDAGENAVMAMADSKAPYIHPLRKLEKEVRSQHSKLVKSLNLSLEKKDAMKAMADAQASSLMGRMS